MAKRGEANVVYTLRKIEKLENELKEINKEAEKIVQENRRLLLFL